MRLNLTDSILKVFPGLYRQDKIQERIEDLGWNKFQTCLRLNVQPQTLNRVLKGKAVSKTVWPISQALGLDWAELHNLKLTESEIKKIGSHLAGRNGDSKKAG